MQKKRKRRPITRAEPIAYRPPLDAKQLMEKAKKDLGITRSDVITKALRNQYKGYAGKRIVIPQEDAPPNPVQNLQPGMSSMDASITAGLQPTAPDCAHCYREGWAEAVVPSSHPSQQIQNICQVHTSNSVPASQTATS